MLRLLPISDHAKDAEILALRHQIAVLQRQLHGQKIQFTPADRAFLAGSALLGSCIGRWRRRWRRYRVAAGAGVGLRRRCGCWRGPLLARGADLAAWRGFRRRDVDDDALPPLVRTAGARTVGALPRVPPTASRSAVGVGTRSVNGSPERVNIQRQPAAAVAPRRGGAEWRARRPRRTSAAAG
jgi:hypothetical protein